METKEKKQPKATDETHSPKKWWQWFFLYPAFGVAFISAIPTFVEAYRSIQYNVPWGNSSSAKLQDDMWQKNLACTSAPIDPLSTANNVQVDATICKSGDVLVKIFSPDGNKFYSWVSINSVMTTKSSGLNIISQAYAGEVRETIHLALSGNVICQRFLNPGRLLRRISVPGQGCFDEVVNTYTGYVESSSRAPCNPQC